MNIVLKVKHPIKNRLRKKLLSSYNEQNRYPWEFLWDYLEDSCSNSRYKPLLNILGCSMINKFLNTGLWTILLQCFSFPSRVENASRMFWKPWIFESISSEVFTANKRIKNAAAAAATSQKQNKSSNKRKVSHFWDLCLFWNPLFPMKRVKLAF